MALELVASPDTLYRVGRLPNPFVWRPPRKTLAQTPHPHDGYRWDAPEADFATLYFGAAPWPASLRRSPITARTRRSTPAYAR